jgi:hypothetical protein
MATLALVGATAAEATIGADRMASGRTAIDADWTGFALANAVCCTAITAPGAPRLTYCTLVTLTFVILTLLTMVVLVTLTRLRYTGLV